MSETQPFEGQLSPRAEPAVEVVRALRAAGCVALLAGGCVRDLLLGRTPQDYDVATDAQPARVCELFRKTRQVGAQFGVVLVHSQRRWIEVATFRTDGPYLDGRRPSQVTFTDARHDALRRDFTINGMFLDPLDRTIIDYVEGRADLEARLVRAIGEPAARFKEDHLRLLRAIRFAARLAFEIEPDTHAAIIADAPHLADVAAERVREELEKMLVHASRRRALRMMATTGLLPRLWPQAGWTAGQIEAADRLLACFPEKASFEAAFAVLVCDRTRPAIEELSRALTLSNEQREAVLWLVRHRADLDDPAAVSLAALKMLMAAPAFDDLLVIARARYDALVDGPQRRAALERRLAAIAPEAIQPPPFITGEDLLKRGLTPGPAFKILLDELYNRQLNETIRGRGEALAALDALLAATPKE